MQLNATFVNVTLHANIIFWKVCNFQGGKYLKKIIIHSDYVVAKSAFFTESRESGLSFVYDIIVSSMAVCRWLNLEDTQGM